jgi:hypothetical protein
MPVNTAGARLFRAAARLADRSRRGTLFFAAAPLDRTTSLCLYSLYPTQLKGRSRETQTRAGWEAAPAGGVRCPAPGRSRDPTGRHYGRSAGSLLDWDWLDCLVPGSADPGTEKPPGGAPGGASPFANGEGTPRQRVGRLRQPLGRPRKPPRFPALRSPFSGARLVAPKGRGGKDGVPGADQEYGR